MTASSIRATEIPYWRSLTEWETLRFSEEDDRPWVSLSEDRRELRMVGEIKPGNAVVAKETAILHPVPEQEAGDSPGRIPAVRFSSGVFLMKAVE